MKPATRRKFFMRVLLWVSGLVLRLRWHWHNLNSFSNWLSGHLESLLGDDLSSLLGFFNHLGGSCAVGASSSAAVFDSVEWASLRQQARNRTDSSDGQK
jgi:hypothetical protein